MFPVPRPVSSFFNAPIIPASGCLLLDIPLPLSFRINQTQLCAESGEQVTAIDEIFHEDAVFYDPKGGIFRGRDEIDRIAGVIKATHPDFEYQPLFPPEELGDAGRVRWVSGTPGKPPAYAGTDFIVARNGRIASVYLFFDSLP